MAPGLPERSSAGRQSVQGLPVVRSPSDDPPRGSALDFDAADDLLAPARPRSFGRDSARSGATFALLLVLGALWVYLTFCLMPDPRALARTAGVEPDTVLLKLPRSFDELHRVRATLQLYRGHYLLHVLLLYTSLFLFLQAFMVPGCFFLNLLVGAVFPPLPALVYVTALTTGGCCLNYLLSKHLLSGIMRGLFPRRIAEFQVSVSDHADHLFYYILCLRIVPMLPAWTVNVASPLARVPLRDFALATALGFQPQLLIIVQAGQAAGSLTSFADLYSWKTFATLTACGLLALVPVIAKRVLPAHWLPAKPERNASERLV